MGAFDEKHLKIIRGEWHSEGKLEGKGRTPPPKIVLMKPDEKQKYAGFIMWQFKSSQDRPLIHLVDLTCELKPSGIFYLMNIAPIWTGYRVQFPFLKLGYWARVIKEGQEWQIWTPKQIFDSVDSLFKEEQD